MFHGQKYCYFSLPACGRCVVLDQCPFGQARLGGKAAGYLKNIMLRLRSA
jgi:endonuclease-3